jgi:molecular chaperone DnaK (HSP70)
MGQKIAIDFGTTNSVVARWDEATAQSHIIDLPTIGDASVEDRPSVVPSLIYVNDARNQQFTVGQAVRNARLDAQRDNRLFRNFKRGIVSSPAPEPRTIDGLEFADRDAGTQFVKQVLEAIPFANEDIDQLVLTAPVAAFEGYLAWLNDVIDEIDTKKIRVVDESTAAALGYAVTEPGAVVLVFDFGGGTLDLSLVQLPEHQKQTGGFLRRLVSNEANASKHAARVIAKAGRVIGGSDIDQWLVTNILQRTNLTPEQLGKGYTPLVTECEKAKIALSTDDSSEISFHVGDKQHTITITRDELEALLRENGFYDALRRVVDKVMHVARQRGIFKEDIHYVLMVGGTSLMPSVQHTLGEYFTDMAVRADKPFTAVAEGALQLAAGYGLEDYLVHSYGLRHLTPDGAHEWDEIIAMGSGYPIKQPVEVLLGAAHDQQREIEFVIGEIDTEAVSMVELKYEDGQAVFVADAASSEQQIVPLNEADALKMLAKLDPPGTPGQDRLRVMFTVDDRRRLRMTVYDLLAKKLLLDDVALVTLQ